MFLESELNDLSDELLIKILKSGIIINDSILDRIDDFLKIDCFNIFRTFTNFKYSKLITLLESFSIEEFEKIIYILFYIKNKKTYTSKNIRHLCKEVNFNKNKIKNAYKNIAKKNKAIGDWLKINIFSEVTILDNSFDYNLCGENLNLYDEKQINSIENILINIREELYDIGNIYEIRDNFELKYLEKVLFIISKNIQNVEFINNTIGNNSEYCGNNKYIEYNIGEYVQNNNLKELLTGKFILELIENFSDFFEEKSLKDTINGQEKSIENIEKVKRLLNTLSRFIGKNDLEKSNLPKLKPVLNQKYVSGRIVVLDGNDEEALKHLNPEDIVVVHDYTTKWSEMGKYTIPKAIIFGGDVSGGSHSTYFASTNGIACYHIPLAEKYFIEYNGLYVNISESGELELLEKENHISPYNENLNREGEKAKGLEKSDLKLTSLSGKLFYDILNTYYIDEDNKFSYDLNDILQLPFEDLKQLFNTLKPGKSINYEKLSKDALEILNVISKKSEILDKLISENNISFPLALRSDFLNEDKDGKRNAGAKDSYLNIRNKEELKKSIIEMIKQEFSSDQLRYKIENNIYPAFCTFGAIIQEMAIKQENEAERLLSGVATVELDDNGEFVINSTLCIGLNEGITGSDSKTIESQLDGKELIIEQNSCKTIDKKKGGTKKVTTNITFDLNNEIQSLIRNKLIELSKYDLENDELKEKYGKFEVSFEFSVLDGKFILLQKNIIKL